MKFAITGATGFIGKHLISSLVNRGYAVVAIDLPTKLSTVDDYIDNLKVSGYSFGRHNSTLIELRPCDLLGQYEPKRLIEGSDILVHLAGLSNPRQASLNPNLAERVNVDITRRLTETGAPILFASTYLLYKPRNQEFKPNEDTPIGENLPAYERTKLEAEKLIMTSKDYVICRLTNNYGNGQSSGFLVPDAISKIKNAEGPVEIFNPETVRDFIFVGDTINGLIAIIESCQRGVFNIGSGESHTIKEMYDTIGNQLGNKVGYVAQSAEKTFLVADISRLRPIGWNPKTSIEAGIELALR